MANHLCKCAKKKTPMSWQTENTAMVLDGETLRPEGIYTATGEERGCTTSKFRCDDVPGLKPSGHPGADGAKDESRHLIVENEHKK